MIDIPTTFDSLEETMKYTLTPVPMGPFGDTEAYKVKPYAKPVVGIVYRGAGENWWIYCNNIGRYGSQEAAALGLIKRASEGEIFVTTTPKRGADQVPSTEPVVVTKIWTPLPEHLQPPAESVRIAPSLEGLEPEDEIVPLELVPTTLVRNDVALQAYGVWQGNKILGYVILVQSGVWKIFKDPRVETWDSAIPAARALADRAASGETFVTGLRGEASGTGIASKVTTEEVPVALLPIGIDASIRVKSGDDTVGYLVFNGTLWHILGEPRRDPMPTFTRFGDALTALVTRYDAGERFEGHPGDILAHESLKMQNEERDALRERRRAGRLKVDSPRLQQRPRRSAFSGSEGYDPMALVNASVGRVDELRAAINARGVMTGHQVDDFYLAIDLLTREDFEWSPAARTFLGRVIFVLEGLDL